MSCKNMFVYGTRPELIKLFPVIRETKSKYVACTGQHRDLLDGSLLKPDINLDIMEPGKNLNTVVDAVLCNISWVIAGVKPERVVVQGDTATAFATALAAFNVGTPVAHVEAGLRTYDTHNPWPEEAYRQFITTIADIHFAPTQQAVLALKKTMPVYGLNRLYVTGNPIVDAVMELAPKPSVEKSVIVTMHRREADVSMYSACIRYAAEKYKDFLFKVVVHPNKTGQTLKQLLGNGKNIKLLQPMGYKDFLKELAKCYLVITDSGGLMEEGLTLHKPVVVMRSRTERYEGIGKGAHLTPDTKTFKQAVDGLFANPLVYLTDTKHENPFGDGTAGKQIARVLNG